MVPRPGIELDKVQRDFVPLASAEAVAAFEEVIGRGRVLTIPGGSHSPQRVLPAETVSALLRCLG